MQTETRAWAPQPLICLLALFALILLVFWLPERTMAGSRPNIVLVQVDDMSVSHLGAKVIRNGRRLPAMPVLLGQARQGANFKRYYASLPLCGPSRASLLTGQLPHNSGMRTNSGGHGYEGWTKRDGESETLPVWLQEAGYRTTHVGKYLNRYGEADERVVPPGWSNWVTPTQNNGALYYGADFNINGRIVSSGGSFDSPDMPWCRIKTIPMPGSCKHTSDLYTAYAVQEIRQSARSLKPFYLQVDFNAPHDDGRPPEGPARQGRLRSLEVADPPQAPTKRTGVDFDDPRFLRNIPPLNRTEQAEIRRRWENEVASLRGVDQSLGMIIRTLRQTGQLRNTFIFFISDNGIFHGQHRISYGKYMPQEPSTRQPLIINGPGVESGVRKSLSSTPDVAATILDLARARPGLKPDGISLLPELRGANTGARAIVLQGFTTRGGVGPQIGMTSKRDPNAARRLAFSGFVAGRWKYIRYSYGDEELYDIVRDPWEENNLAGVPKMSQRLRWARSADLELSRCRGRSCRPPASLRGYGMLKRVPSPQNQNLLKALLWVPGGGSLAESSLEFVPG